MRPTVLIPLLVLAAAPPLALGLRVRPALMTLEAGDALPVEARRRLGIMDKRSMVLCFCEAPAAGRTVATLEKFDGSADDYRRRGCDVVAIRPATSQMGPTAELAAQFPGLSFLEVLDSPMSAALQLGHARTFR